MLRVLEEQEVERLGSARTIKVVVRVIAATNKGLEEAQSKLGVEGRVLLSKSNGDYVPNLTPLAQQQTDLMVPVGFLMADATNTVASKLPTSNFAIVDFSATGLKDKPKNVQGLLFKEQEAGYLAGYLAGLWAKDNNAKAVSIATRATR